jgi:hypothetical protein
MPRTVLAFALVVASVVTGGCLTTAPTQVDGMLLDVDVHGPHAWVAEFDNSVAPSKSGRAEASGILGVAYGDASIRTAMQAGGLTQIHHVDTRTITVLGLYAKSTTIVWGE